MSFIDTLRNVFTTPTSAFIDSDNNLFSPTGEHVGSYSRRRDAVRGAKRRGWELA